MSTNIKKNLGVAYSKYCHGGQTGGIFCKKGEGVALYHLLMNGCSFSLGGDNLITYSDVDIYYDKIVLVKGAVGSGKTNLLKALGGILYPKVGEFQNVNLAGAALNAVFIHSQPEFNFVTSHVGDELRLAGVPEEEFKAMLGKDIHKLSGGELKKLSILMALSSEGSGVILLDEPLDMLDDEESAHVTELIIESSNKRPFIIATHDDNFDSHADVIINAE